jgi:hypothetical protein
VARPVTARRARRNVGEMRWLRRSIVVLGALAVLAAGAGGASGAGGERANHRAAQRDAAGLFGRVALPVDASPSAAEPAGDHHFLARPGQVPAAINLVDRHGWWTTPDDKNDVSAFVREHQPKGTRAVTEGVGDGQFPTDAFTFELAPAGHVLGTRWLVVSLIALRGGGTGVRVDAEVQWLVPRPAGERIPLAARALQVTVRRPDRPPTSDITVTNPVKVKRMASLIDSLETQQPGVSDCTGRADDPVVTLTFRAVPGGRVLAQARQIVDPTPRGGFCEPMTLSITGRPQTPLLGGATVVHAAQHLLGVRVPR